MLWKMPNCVREYCTAQADPALADGCCLVHSADPNKPTAAMQQAIVDFAKNGYKLAARGWVFPFDVDLSGTGIWQLNLRDAVFKGNVTFANSYFNPTSEASFEGTTFERDVTFSNFQFQCPTDFRGTTFKRHARFDNADFRNAYFVYAIFDGDATFDDARSRELQFFDVKFNEAVGFRRFSAETLRFTNTAFGQWASFEETDMTRALFSHCDVRGLQLSRAVNLAHGEFFDCQWPRGGVFEERRARDTQEVPRYREAARVYRELRRGSETRRQYDDADTFDWREMEMRRLAVGRGAPRLGELRRTIFSVEALYRWLGSYGHSLRLPVLWLVVLVVVVYPYLFAFAGIELAGQTYSVRPPTDRSSVGDGYLDLVAFSTRTAALISEPVGAALSPAAQLVEVSLRILGPLFALLFSLAVRRRLRR